MTKAKLILLRHGQTEYNKLHLMTGQKDIPLTEEGEEQAREAGKLISEFHFHKVYSSTLSRAFNTAALALESSGRHGHLRNADGTWQIEQRNEIVELNVGDFTGRNKTDPDIAAIKRVYDVPWPGGECEKDVVERVKKFYDAEILPRLERGETVLVVAHSVVLKAFDIALGLEPIPGPETLGTKKSPPNATPIIYDYENGVLKSVSHIVNPKSFLPPAANQNTPPAEKKKQNPKL